MHEDDLKSNDSNISSIRWQLTFPPKIIISTDNYYEFGMGMKCPCGFAGFTTRFVRSRSKHKHIDGMHRKVNETRRKYLGFFVRCSPVRTIRQSCLLHRLSTIDEWFILMEDAPRLPVVELKTKT